MGRPAVRVAEPIIELGEVGDELTFEPQDAPVGSSRGMAALLTVVLAVVGLVADAAPTRFEPVLTTASSPTDFRLGRDVLYVFDGVYPPNTVAAYRLRDGRRLWQVDSNRATTYEGVNAAGPLTLLVPNACISSRPVSTVAVDTGSGHEMWRRPGVPHQPIDGGRMMVLSRPGPTYGCGGASTMGERNPLYWDGVELDTGRVVWSAPVAPYVRIFMDPDSEGRARAAVFAAHDGTLTSRDLRTGAITGWLNLPELVRPPISTPPGDLMSAGTAEVAVVAGLVVVSRRTARPFPSIAGMLEVSAYDQTTLEQRWTTETAVGRSARRGAPNYYGLGDCGPVLCLYGQGWTAFYDPADGRERWNTTLTLLAVDGDRGLFADGRSAGDAPLGGLSVRDVRTGRLVMDLGGWRTLGGQRAPVADPVLAFTNGDDTWFGRLQLSGARLVALGSAPGWYGSCNTERDYFACRRVDGSVRVWRAPGR